LPFDLIRRQPSTAGAAVSISRIDRARTGNLRNMYAISFFISVGNSAGEKSENQLSRYSLVYGRRHVPTSKHEGDLVMNKALVLGAAALICSMAYRIGG